MRWRIAANPQAKRAAVIGVGSGITTATLLAPPTLQRVDTIEIERRMVDGAKLFSERNAALWTDERSHFVFDDAKAWLARATTPWDIVVSEPSNPWVSGVASLFTAETYERVAKHLAPGGVFVQWIQIYEVDGAVAFVDLSRAGRAFPALRRSTRAAPGDLIIVASRDRPPVVDAAALFKHRELATMLKQAGVSGPADIDARWRGDTYVINALMAAFDAPANSDYRPYVDLNAARTRFVQRELPAAVRGESRAAADARGARRLGAAHVRASRIRWRLALASALVGRARGERRAAGCLRGLCRTRCARRASSCARASPAARSRSCSKARSARRSPSTSSPPRARRLCGRR